MIQINTILLFSLVLLLAACQSNSEVNESISPEILSDRPEVTDPFIQDQQVEKNRLFYDHFTEMGLLESRQDMSEILEEIGAADPNNEEFTLINVLQTQDGYTGYNRICDERFNGSLRFLTSSENAELEEFYGFYEPFLEFQGQDLFLFAIEEIFVQPNEEKITLTVRSANLHSESGNYYTDMSDPTEEIEIWGDFEFGTVAHYGNNYYIDAHGVEKLNTATCTEFEH